MATTVADRTVLPPSDTSMSDLAELVASLGPDDLPSLAVHDGRSVQLPEEVFDALRGIVAALSIGKAVSVTSQDTTLTTQAAAELLGISRPTLVRLLEANEIPYEQPGRHRRVQLSDLLDYQERIRYRRREALDAMVSDAAEDDAYTTSAGFVATR